MSLVFSAFQVPFGFLSNSLPVRPLGMCWSVGELGSGRRIVHGCQDSEEVRERQTNIPPFKCSLLAHFSSTLFLKSALNQGSDHESGAFPDQFPPGETVGPLASLAPQTFLLLFLLFLEASYHFSICFLPFSKWK